MPADDRDAILRRRARFVAAALASAGVVGPAAQGCAKKDVSPPATSVQVAEPDAEAPEDEAGAVPSEQPDADLPAGEGEDAGAPPPPIPGPCLSPPAPDPGPGPQVCLEVPQACLSAPEDTG